MVNEDLNINTIIQSLSDWNKTIESHFCSITRMLSSDEIQKIIEEYDVRNADRIDLGFNIFTLISDLYYRENFHRDIIYEFLNPNGSHKQGSKYLMLFLDMLNINRSFFQSAVVNKEEPIDNQRRIDTLIIDNSSKKAIIIENKMNNAGDMYRQLPDYYNYVQRLGYEVMRIVYLPLLHNKEPDERGWSKEEIYSVHSCLKIIPAFSNKRDKNLCDDWLVPCIDMSDNIDCLSGLRQYVKLIKYLNINNMDSVILEKFYENLKVGENFKTATSISNMLKELPNYLAERIRNKYRYNCSPFVKVEYFRLDNATFKEFTLNNENQIYTLEIWCIDNEYEMFFYNNLNEQEDIKSIFKDSVALKEFKPKQEGILSNVFLHLGFNEEYKVLFIIDLLLVELSAMKQ